MVNESPFRLASVDIGSNAVRLFVGQKSRSGKVRVLKDQRASIRLGKDAFSAGYIRPKTQKELEQALNLFRQTCEKLRVQAIRAVATSALRDSRNSRKVIAQLKSRTGIRVSVIDGHREASLLHKAVAHTIDLKGKTALVADIGGGSLEVVLSRGGKLAGVRTLPLGTVRLLSKIRKNPGYEDIAHWVRTPLYRLRFDFLSARHKPIDLLVGTGGNLRAMGKLCYRLGFSRSRNRFTRHNLEALVLRLFQLGLSQRMKRFQLKKDRADVILPAAVVMLELMRIFEINEIVVPNVGLKNGVFWESMEKVRFAKTRG